MDEPSDVTQQRIEKIAETRAALEDKLETLEHRVVGTVQEAAGTVAETFHHVKDAVADTVESVKGTVQDTVETVRETFDLKRQVERHPWPMMLGGVAVGFLGGAMLHRSTRRDTTSSISHPGMPMTTLATASEDRRHPAPVHAPEPRGWFRDLADRYHEEIDMLKSLAVGSVMGLLRNLVTSAAGAPPRSKFTEVIDDMTARFTGRFTDPDRREHPDLTQGETHEERNPTKMGRTMGATERPREGTVGSPDGR